MDKLSLNIKEIENKFREFVRIDLSSLNGLKDIDLTRKIEDLWFPLFGIGIPSYFDDINKRFFLYRIVSHKINNRNKIHEYSYPDSSKGKIAPLNRANFEGEPVFYAAIDQDTAHVEFCKHNEGFKGEICISIWEVVRPIKVSPVLTRYEIEHNPLARHLFNGFAIKNPEVFEFARIVSELFRNDSKYLHSALIARSILKGNEGIEMITYPSVECGKINFAIIPDAIKSGKVVFKEVLKVNIVEKIQPGKDVCVDDFCDYGKFDGKLIQWTDKIDFRKENKNIYDLRERFFVKFEGHYNPILH